MKRTGTQESAKMDTQDRVPTLAMVHFQEFPMRACLVLDKLVHLKNQNSSDRRRVNY